MFVLTVLLLTAVVMYQGYRAEQAEKNHEELVSLLEMQDWDDIPEWDDELGEYV